MTVAVAVLAAVTVILASALAYASLILGKHADRMAALEREHADRLMHAAGRTWNYPGAVPVTTPPPPVVYDVGPEMTDGA